MKKQLKIYRENDTKSFIIERINEFNYSTRRYVGLTIENVLEALENYPNLSDYDIHCDGELFGSIVNLMQKQ